MRKEPGFIKEFSREESKDERKEKVREIREQRARFFDQKKKVTEFKKEKSDEERRIEARLEKRLREIKELQTKIDASRNGVGIITKLFERGALEAQRQELLEMKERDEQKLGTVMKRIKDVDNEPLDRSGLQHARETVNEFYDKERQKWEKAPYAKEDITKHFSSEHLASLSLDEYTLLMKRFPREMVAHVTRQGIRDHVESQFHQAGEGEYADGFIKMAEGGRLKSILGIAVTENEKEDIIARALRLEKMKNKEEALEELDAFLTPTQTDRMVGGRFADRMAVHFAVEEVADGYYGSERGNEIFIAYPSAMIASQYFFNKDLRQAPSGTANDVFVWTQEEKGIDMNAGITFIPAEAQVDPKTGSKYELDENKKPKVIKKNVAAIRSVIADPEFSAFVEHAQETLGRLPWNATAEDVSRELKPHRDTLEKKMTLYKDIDPRVRDVILHYQNLSDFLSRKNAVNRDSDKKQALENLNSEIERKLRESELLYEKPANAVPSKEFWEGHFAKNPDAEPNKIVYYKGNDPTKALHNWRREAGISPKGEGEGHLGFAERNIHMDAAAAMTGSDRFRSIAEEVIEKRFDKEKAVL